MKMDEPPVEYQWSDISLVHTIRTRTYEYILPTAREDQPANADNCVLFFRFDRITAYRMIDGHRHRELCGSAAIPWPHASWLISSTGFCLHLLIPTSHIHEYPYVNDLTGRNPKTMWNFSFYSFYYIRAWAFPQYGCEKPNWFMRASLAHKRPAVAVTHNITNIVIPLGIEVAFGVNVNALRRWRARGAEATRWPSHEKHF